MLVLIEQSENILSNTSIDFKRFLYHKIKWNNRLIGIKGARGTGKTTMALQWLKSLNLPNNKAAYFTLDDIYFTNNSLKETIAQFHKMGGEYLVIDEVHKYPNWSVEIKNIYDIYPQLKIIFTGSSIIDINQEQGDLSRRALIYELPGMSYREFLSLKYQLHLPILSLEQIIQESESLKSHFPSEFRPLEYFTEYLRCGYYPFTVEDSSTVHQRLNQLMRTIIENDMAEIKDFDVRNAKKMLQLLYLLSQQVPYKPNISELAQKTSIHRNTIPNYIQHLEQAKILNLLYPAGNSFAILRKPEKVYLNNTNLIYALGGNEVNIGNVRETFFLSQLMIDHQVNVPEKGDFLVNNQHTFEVGGKSKTRKQITGIENAWVIQDDLNFPIGKNIPLWIFGFLY